MARALDIHPGMWSRGRKNYRVSKLVADRHKVVDDTAIARQESASGFSWDAFIIPTYAFFAG